MKKDAKFNVGQWLPSDQEFYNNWLKKVLKEAEAEQDQTLLPPVQALKDLIESDRYLWNLFHMMFEEVPAKYVETPMDTPAVHNYHQMLRVINRVMHRAPEFNATGLVGFPINAILDYPMATKAGYVAFMDPRVNQKLRDILDYWGRFLQSPDSTYVLNRSKEGWLGDEALKSMCNAAYGENFHDIFACPNNDIDQQYGFKSWDHFFTRTFNPGVRPVANADAPDSIANACESAPYRIAHNLPLKAKFWIKGQPYSLIDLLHNDSLTSEFVGGTLYQAFLSALSYHRWNSPVSGTVVKAYNLYGSYYSETLPQGFENPNGPDPAAPNDSQAYITETASRAVIFIKADNPKIGLMCFVAVGMAEVSGNEITVKVGQHINKGDQLGIFHFGGSTHVLLFRPGVNVKFNLHGQEPSLGSHNIKVHDEIARVE